MEVKEKGCPSTHRFLNSLDRRCLPVVEVEHKEFGEEHRKLFSEPFVKFLHSTISPFVSDRIVTNWLYLIGDDSSKG